MKPTLRRTSGNPSSVIVFAGVDTTASTLARLHHLLAEHPDAQAKLRAEAISSLS
ncbi:hypothetical protein OBBRIDRAFT_792130 [Obba rivulosa]|uniref:Cytochrome P450 n=1 Tax=Obba rivulosa TaxID=1052685 RepID=A0A8E2AWB2_9APHY|nr:hypothetical protein OBBRIDRAFT_792130 [Obba rivulosa]